MAAELAGVPRDRLSRVVRPGHGEEEDQGGAGRVDRGACCNGGDRREEMRLGMERVGEGNAQLIDRADRDKIADAIDRYRSRSRVSETFREVLSPYSKRNYFTFTTRSATSSLYSGLRSVSAPPCVTSSDLSTFPLSVFTHSARYRPAGTSSIKVACLPPYR